MLLLLVNLIRFIRGSITCIAKGRFTERLINILNKKGFSYWNIIPVDGGISFSIYANEYNNLRLNLRGTGIKTSVKRKSGLPFLMKRYSNRKGLALGLVLFIALMILFSKFIWVTTVSGNEKVETTKIISVLKDNGLYSGAYANSIDNKFLERKVIETIPDIRWISVNITGCKAEVEVKESYKIPKILDENDVCDIKASRDAIVLEDNVTGGTGMVKKGSAVMKGQLLISGMITGAKGDRHFVKARGKIIGRTTYNKTYALPKRKIISALTGEKMDRSRVNFLWFSFPLSYSYIPFDNYKVLKKTENLNVNNTLLPVSVTREYIENIKKSEYSLKENKKALKKIAVLCEAFDFKNKEIESRKYKYHQDKKNYYLDVKYTVKEDICKKSPLSE